jgi:hypothetical protein
MYMLKWTLHAPLLYPLYTRLGGPQSSLDAMEKKNISCLCQESNPDCLDIQSLA